MSKRKASKSAAASKRRFPSGLAGSVLLLFALAWTGVPGDARADTIVLKSGEVVEGSIIEATRNTVIVQRAIGGMRQMSIRDIEEVRIELARGQPVSGELLSWAEGVYRVRSGGQVIRISEGAILSREPGGETTAQAPADPPPRPLGKQTVRMAAAPATPVAEEAIPAAPATPVAEEKAAAAPAAPAREQMAGQGPEEEQRPAEQEQSPAAGEEQSLAADQNRSLPIGEEQSSAALEEQSPAAAEDRTPAAAEDERPATAEAQSPDVSEDRSQAAERDRNPPAGGAQSLAMVEEQSPAAEQDQSPPIREEQHLAATEEQGPSAEQNQSPATGEEQSLAAIEEQSPATGEQRSLAVKASAEPGADAMVFRIELSRPAEQTIVLIYGTVDGTAKAGEDFEPQQGMVTIAPGAKGTEVRVPLIEQSAAQGEKRFELFLTADPKVAEVVDRRVIATINGDD